MPCKATKRTLDFLKAFTIESGLILSSVLPVQHPLLRKQVHLSQMFMNTVQDLQAGIELLLQLLGSQSWVGSTIT